MRLHHAGAIEPLPGPRAAGNRLVILVARIAKCEVVHGALAGRHHAQGAIQGVGNAARRLHIARHDRRRRIRVQHGAGRDDHLQRFQTTRIERNIVIYQRAKNIQHSRHAHGGGRIEIIELLWRGTREVNDCAAIDRIDANRHLNLRTVVQRERKHTIFQAGDDTAHRLLSVVLYVAHVSLHHRQAKVSHHAAQFLHALLVGCNLGLQVRHVLLRVARRVVAALQQRHHLGLAQHTPVHQLEVVDLHALFFNAGGKRRH